MEFKLGQTKIELDFYFFAALAVFLMVDKSGLILFVIIAVAAHELAHVVAMLALGVQVQRLRFAPFGLRLERRGGSIVGFGREICISLAGSLVNMILGQICFMMPPSRGSLLLGAANMALGLFNLLPVQGLDGGRVVEEVLDYCFGQRGRKAAGTVSVLFTVVLYLLTLYLWRRGSFNLSLVLLCIYVTVLPFRKQG